MKNNFPLTEKSNEILLKVLKTGFMIFAILLFVVFLKYPANRYLTPVIGFGIFCLIPLLALKSYKVIGRIIFEENLLLAETKGKTIRLPFSDIRSVKLILRGRKRNSYFPSVVQPIGVNRPNGTGNILVIESEDHLYKFDIFLENPVAEKYLDFHLKRLADAGVPINKRKMPAILGDSI